MSAPAGWYPTPEGRLRYWDGAGWTQHVAPDPAESPRPHATEPCPEVGRPVAPHRVGVAVWLGWGGLALAALLGLASSGVSGLFSLAGVYLLVVAVVALIRGHVGWARIRGRAAAGAAMGAAVMLSIVGGATATPANGPLAAQSPAPVPPSPSAASPTTASASPTPSTTPTATPTPARTTAPPGPQTARRGTALAAVAALPVKGRAPRTGYDRDEFGHAWYDADRNGCDTRNDVLRRDLTKVTLKAGTNGCLVLGGTLTSPYTARTIRFIRGTSTSSAVQIDHVVALSDAWQKGAQQLSRSTRTAFANDPLNLLAVDGPTNSAKSDGDAATWLPPSKGYRCAYVARQVAVKLKYHLWVTAAEREAMARILGACPTVKLPTSKTIPLGGGRVIAATPRPTPAPTKTSTTLDPQFGTCGAANDAGYGPYYQGKDPEYDWYQDRDHDGIVCER